nr:MAG TPA: hypothetical protein [Caudoviricetes sp.]DAS53431.1 MAG TPA: hypothetical protein [Caudoviricetes sp.]
MIWHKDNIKNIAHLFIFLRLCGCNFVIIFTYTKA